MKTPQEAINAIIEASKITQLYKVVKNKVAAPFKQTEFDLMYNEGISKEGEIIALGEKMGIISKSGSSYKYGDTPLGRGYDATRQFLKSKENKFNKQNAQFFITSMSKSISSFTWGSKFLQKTI